MVHIIGETRDGEEVLIESCEYYEDAQERQDAIMSEGVYISTWLETDNDR